MSKLNFYRYQLTGTYGWSDDSFFRENTYGLKIYPAGTNNCQMAIGGNFENFIYGKRKATIIDELRQIRVKVTSKSLFFIDIHQKQAKRMRGMFPNKYILVDSPYTSSNGSLMNIMVIDMRSLDERTKTGSYRIK